MKKEVYISKHMEEKMPVVFAWLSVRLDHPYVKRNFGFIKEKVDLLFIGVIHSITIGVCGGDIYGKSSHI